MRHPIQIRLPQDLHDDLARTLKRMNARSSEPVTRSWIVRKALREGLKVLNRRSERGP